MKRVGLVGWRGMVGSVLMGRMKEERDFDHIDPVFFTTSNVGGKGPDIGRTIDGGQLPPLKDANSIDAASTLRMKDEAIIILDPVNRNVIQDGIANSVKTYVGGNCTVSLMLM